VSDLLLLGEFQGGMKEHDKAIASVQRALDIERPLGEARKIIETLRAMAARNASAGLPDAPSCMPKKR